MNSTIRYALKMAAVSLGIGLVLFALKQFTGTPFIHEKYWIILVFLYLLSLVASTFVNFGVQKYRQNFNLFFFPALIFRFFASVIFILVMVLTDLQDVLFFVLDFFVLYLLFQVFEITSLMTNLRSHLENRGNEDN